MMGVMKFEEKAKSSKIDHEHQCTYLVQKGTFLFKRGSVLTKHPIGDMIAIPENQSYCMKNAGDDESMIVVVFKI